MSSHSEMNSTDYWQPWDDIGEQLFCMHPDTLLNLDEYCTNDEQNDCNQQFKEPIDYVKDYVAAAPSRTSVKSFKKAAWLNDIKTTDDTKMGLLLTTNETLHVKDELSDHLKAGIEITAMIKSAGISNDGVKFEKQNNLERILNQKKIIYEKNKPILLDHKYFKFSVKNRDHDETKSNTTESDSTEYSFNVCANDSSLNCSLSSISHGHSQSQLLLLDSSSSDKVHKKCTKEILAEFMRPTVSSKHRLASLYDQPEESLSSLASNYAQNEIEDTMSVNGNERLLKPYKVYFFRKQKNGEKQ